MSRILIFGAGAIGGYMGVKLAEAAVVAAPDPTLGEEVAAFVVLRPGAAADAETLIAWCRERLAAFKYPRRVTLLEALPRSATGKVLKAKLTG